MLDPTRHKAKTALNRASSPKVLRYYGVPFETKNGGAHLICKSGGKVVDFWPGTGKWIVRGTDKSGRGVFALLRHVKK